MGKVLLIARKEFGSIMRSPLFYLIAGICCIIWTMQYLSFLERFAQMGMRAAMQGGAQGQSLFNTVFVQHISVVNLVFIFALPAFTMWLVAEEKKMRTFDLLLTSPVSSTQIALGKFFAGMGIAFVLLLVSFLYPAGTAMIADFSWGTLLTLYLGVFLLSGVYVASGLFASSMTESVVLAVIMGVIFNFMIWFVGQSLSGSQTQWVANVADYLSVGPHLVNFLKGTLKVSSVVFFVSVIAFFVFLSQRVIESARWR